MNSRAELVLSELGNRSWGDRVYVTSYNAALSPHAFLLFFHGYVKYSNSVCGELHVIYYNINNCRLI
jgi:hypothetical protein